MLQSTFTLAELLLIWWMVQVTLSTDDETQLQALLEKMGLNVGEVKTIEDLTKVLPKVKREKKTPQKTKLSLGADEEVSNDEDEDGEEMET